VAIVENASLADERITYTTLRALAATTATPPTGPTILLAGPQFTAQPARDVQPADPDADRRIGNTENRHAR
jgi:hypothetical protein